MRSSRAISRTRNSSQSSVADPVNTRGAVEPGGGPAPQPSSRALLTLDGVWKRFPGVVALKGVSLDVRAGEVHALLGENGAGKSTLMAVASGTIAPDAGTVEIGGEAIDGLTPAIAQRNGLAIVHQ